MAMFSARAEAIFRDLHGHRVGGWTIRKLIDYGGSAVVLRATKETCDGIVKVFDPELVTEYGELTQLTRIERELSLGKHGQSHLVQIFGGGKCSETGFLYVAMEHVKGIPLSRALGQVPRTSIPLIVSQIAGAAKFLDDMNIAHRDIKPSNIMYSSETSEATLLDLGVIRPIDSVSAGTDDERRRPFIGTLQYSPPEFLLREEEDTTDGWRAVTFYQIGAVLHDLIEQKPIFHEEVSPYARLVNAVQHNQPLFCAQDVPQHIVSLARNCLIKHWRTRLAQLNWSDFELSWDLVSPAATAKRALVGRKFTLSPGGPAWRQTWKTARILRELTGTIHDTLRQWSVEQTFLPPVRIHTATHDVPNESELTVAVEFNLMPDVQNQLAVRINIELFDPGDRVVSVRARAVTNAGSGDTSTTAATTLFSGVFDQNGFLVEWENYFLPIFEELTRPGVSDSLPAQGSASASENSV